DHLMHRAAMYRHARLQRTLVGVQLARRLAHVDRTEGLDQAAAERLMAARDELESLVARDPSRIQWKQDLAEALTELGEVVTALGDYETATAAFARSQQLWTELAETEPRVIAWQEALNHAKKRVSAAQTIQREASP
ncbi:MAG: hypothetical protein AAGA48_40475, partial [Myxococcota bacterium]